MITERPVVVLQLPEKLVVGRAQLFFREIEAILKADRPRVVFDMSAVTQVDRAGIEMLLNSMEEVMKRNGDLKLAAIPPGPAVVLEVTRVNDLFESFDDATEAVQSFYRYPVPVLHPTEVWGERSALETGTI